MQRADSNSGIRIAMALLFGSTLFLSGCSIFHTEIGKPLKKPAVPLVQGKTSVRAVVKELGPPHLVSALSNGFVFLYEYHQIREFQWGVSLKALKLPYFKIVKADSRLSESVRILTFDDRGILRAEGSAVWNEKLSAGAALQWIVSAISLTDTTPFLQSSGSISWGRRLLEPLPKVLNSRQNLTDGSHGVEIISSPDFVGQSTLEMVRPRPLKPESSRRLRSN
jgi:hypothetical protein